MTRKRKKERHRIDAPQKRKMSEVIWDFAGDFIGMGDKDRIEIMSTRVG